MIQTNEKTQARAKSGWAFFCPSFSSVRAATRQSGLSLAGLTEETIFNTPMIPVPLNIGQAVHSVLQRARHFGSNRGGGHLFKSGSNFFVWQSHTRVTNFTVVQ
jgi:hypothetical protein